MIMGQVIKKLENIRVSLILSHLIFVFLNCPLSTMNKLTQMSIDDQLQYLLSFYEGFNAWKHEKEA